MFLFFNEQVRYFVSLIYDYGLSNRCNMQDDSTSRLSKTIFSILSIFVHPMMLQIFVFQMRTINFYCKLFIGYIILNDDVRFSKMFVKNVKYMSYWI